MWRVFLFLIFKFFFLFILFVLVLIIFKTGRQRFYWVLLFSLEDTCFNTFPVGIRVKIKRGVTLGSTHQIV